MMYWKGYTRKISLFRDILEFWWKDRKITKNLRVPAGVRIEHTSRCFLCIIFHLSLVVILITVKYQYVVGYSDQL
jgi:hypothetical protein